MSRRYGLGVKYSYDHEPFVGTNYMTQSNNGWLAMKRNTAELEAHRERVRQVYSRAFGAAKSSSEWVQGLRYVENALTLADLKKVCDSFDIVWKDSGDMITKNEEINGLKDQIKALNAKIEKLEHGRMGKEPANGTVFKIEKRFAEGGPSYIYAAIKASNAWYLTGTSAASSRAYSWTELKDFIGKYSRVWNMTASKEFVH